MFDVAAGPEGALRNSESPAAEFDHFGHEGDVIQGAIAVEAVEYFQRAFHLYQIAEPDCCGSVQMLGSTFYFVKEDFSWVPVGTRTLYNEATRPGVLAEAKWRICRLVLFC